MFTKISIASEQPNGLGAGLDKVTIALPPGLAATGKLLALLKVVVTSELKHYRRGQSSAGSVPTNKHKNFRGTRYQQVQSSEVHDIS